MVDASAGAAPLFTILMPTHDRAALIGPAIRSVLDQSFGDFELVVCGDGCTDDTAQVVAAFDDPRVIWCDLPKGPGFGYANRNIALEGARGSLVAFLSDDDLYLPDHLARFADIFGRESLHWAHSRPLWVHDDGLVVPTFADITFGTGREFFAQRNCLPAGTVVYRRALFDAAGGWPTDVPEAGDWVLWRRMIADLPATALGFLREPTCLHFRAGWRNSREWAPQPHPYMAALADGSRHWPTGLRLDIDRGGASPQHQVLRHLEAAPAATMQRLRVATRRLQDEITWSALMAQPFHRMSPRDGP